MRSQLLQASPDMDDEMQDKTLRYIEQLKERDPLAVLQEDSLTGGKEGGLVNMMKLAPNFEIAMYLAQATGACIVTDNSFRWTEINRAIRGQIGEPYTRLDSLAHNIESSTFAFPQDVADIEALHSNKSLAAYPALVRNVCKYLSNIEHQGRKPTGKHI